MESYSPPTDVLLLLLHDLSQKSDGDGFVSPTDARRLSPASVLSLR